MAPPAVVYVVAAVVGVAAVVAFKEFVYEPHIAPTLEAWAEEFLERRRAARSRRTSAIPVRNRPLSSDASSSPPHNDRRQRDRGESERSLGLDAFSVDGLELEALVSKEVDEWRNAVLQSQERTQDGLRKRRTNLIDDYDGFDSMSTTLDESFTSLTHTPLASTHVISNVSSPLTPSTVSLPQTPTRRFRSESQSTTTQGCGSTSIRAPCSPVYEIPVVSQRVASPGSTALTPRSPTDSANQVDTPSSSPVAIPIYRSPTTEDAPHPSPFTPTYQVIGDDSPFGPLLPDTPRSSADTYSERPFSPITRVMGSSSDASSAGSKETLSSSVSSTGSSRTLGSSGMLRKPSRLVNEVVMIDSDDGSDAEERPRASTSAFVLANEGPGTNESVISSLSERYPAPLTPPVIVSPPASSIGVISAPSSPHSSSPEVLIHHDAMITKPHTLSSPVSQTHPSLPLLQLPLEASSLTLMSRSRSSAHSPISPALSYASFLSPLPMSRAVSESEGDEFLSVVSDDSDWSGSPITPDRDTGPVEDRANNSFLDFEDLTHSAGRSSPEHGDGSESSEVLVSELGQDGGSEMGSDGSWGSARRH